MRNINHIYDKYGDRLIKCTECKKTKKTDFFVTYGGKDSVNTGLCRECARKKGLIK